MDQRILRAARLCAAICAALAAPPAPAAAQQRAGARHRDMKGATPIEVSVRVSAVRFAGDTVILTYVVVNHPRPASGENLRQFLLDTPAPAIRIDSSVATKAWETRTDYRRVPTAVWTDYSDSLVHPGGSSPPLTYRAIGVTDIVRYWAVPDLAVHPPVGEDGPDDGTGFKQYADTGRTVGVVKVPARATSATLFARVGRLFDYSCGAAALITGGGCDGLRDRLDAASKALVAGDGGAARVSLRAFLDDLEAQRGKTVSEGAYALLRSNAAYLLSRP